MGCGCTVSFLVLIKRIFRTVSLVPVLLQSIINIKHRLKSAEEHNFAVSNPDTIADKPGKLQPRMLKDGRCPNISAHGSGVSDAALRKSGSGSLDRIFSLLLGLVAH
jgi:hypothetical protein